VLPGSRSNGLSNIHLGARNGADFVKLGKTSIDAVRAIAIADGVIG
jgi:hypothetical protein